MNLPLSRSPILLFLAFWLAACATPPPAPVVEAGQPIKKRPSQHVVNKGETLYSIAWRYGHDYRKLAAWNGISSPYVIHPGQKLRLTPPAARPGARARSSPPPAKASSPASKPERTATTVHKPARSAASRSSRPVKPVSTRAGQRWRWPVEGKVIRRYANSGGGRKGIDIAGSPGTPIRAAAGGEVVYAGSGLVRYGELVIIKHDDTWLSAYAHNRRLRVSEGQRVEAGQIIAELGSTGADRPMLHFEIRRNGKPVDPLRYLPQR